MSDGPKFGDGISAESFRNVFRHVRMGQSYGHVPPGEDAFIDAVCNLLLHHWKEDAAAIRRECAKKDRARIRELITWIEIAVGPKDGVMANLAAKAKIDELQKELDQT